MKLFKKDFSTSKVTEGSKYQTEFNSATTQALRKKLHVYSSKKDPDFDDSNGKELNIKQVIEQAKDLLGSRVNFEAIVTRKDGNYAYVENVVENVRYGVLVYLGFSSTLPQAFKPGYKLRVHGFVQEYNGQYQISGCSYDLFEYGSTSPDYTKFVRVLDKNASLEPTVVTAKDLNTGKVNLKTNFATHKIIVIANKPINILGTHATTKSGNAISIIFIIIEFKNINKPITRHSFRYHINQSHHHL